MRQVAIFILSQVVCLSSIAQNVEALVTYPRSSQISYIRLNSYNKPAWGNPDPKRTFLLTSITFPSANPADPAWKITVTVNGGSSPGVTFNLRGPVSFQPGIPVPPGAAVSYGGGPLDAVLIGGFYENNNPVYHTAQVDTMLSRLSAKIDSTKSQIFQIINNKTGAALTQIKQDDIVNAIKGDITNQINDLQAKLALLAQQITDLQKALNQPQNH